MNAGTWDPAGTALKMGAALLLYGACLHSLAAGLIYLASTRLEPRLRPDEVWSKWRKKRMPWFTALVMLACVAATTGGMLAEWVALRDNYWWSHRRDLALLGPVGAGAGYLLSALVWVLSALNRSRRSGSGSQKDPEPTSPSDEESAGGAEPR